MNIGDRMKQRRKQLKLTADEVAEKIGVSRSNVYRYEKGDIEKLPLEVLEPLSEILQTTPQQLMGWESGNDILPIYNQLEPPRQKKVYDFAEKELEEQNKVVQFPIEKPIDIVLSAGDNGEWLEGLDAGTVTLYTEPPKHDFIAKVNGRSMEPTFEDGEILFVESAHEARNGQFVVARVNGTGYVKKYLEVDGKPKLLSLNKEYSDVELNEHDRFEIIGVVNL